jgi:hypothetical protein
MKKSKRYSDLRSLADEFHLRTAKPLPRVRVSYSARIIREYWGRD